MIGALFFWSGLGLIAGAVRMMMVPRDRVIEMTEGQLTLMGAVVCFPFILIGMLLHVAIYGNAL